ncbi:MAG: PAS domain-containing protein [Planctomycetaceae bacterium]
MRSTESTLDRTISLGATRLKKLNVLRFHMLTPWILASVVIAVADLWLPSWVAISVLQSVLQLASFRQLAASRVLILTLVLMMATILPGVVRAVLDFDTSNAEGVVLPDHWFAPVRTWVVFALGVGTLVHTDQQQNRKRRLLLRQQLQRKVRRRSAQVRRINEALRREVARRQATQQRLTRTESHLQSLAQRMQLQVLRKDTDGVITYANEAFCRGVGRSVDDVIGSTDADLYPPATAQKYRNDDAQVMATGVPVDHVESHPTPDGETGWVQVFKVPDYDDSDHCIGIQMVFWDVTDTYRRTGELRRSEARKRALFDAAREAVLLVDDEGRIVEANPSAESLLGGGPASLAGCLMDSVAIPDSATSALAEEDLENMAASAPSSRPWVERAVMRWQDLPTSERREMTVRRHDGTVFPAEISVHPIPLENSQGLAVFVRDVTLRHRAIRALRDAKLAAEEASRTKSAFMAGVSHEIRTPLGGITGSAELLAGMDLPPRAKQYVSMIRQSADLLSDVIGDILDFASIEAGRLQVDPAPMDLHQCVGEAFRCLATRASGKDLEMILSISPNVPRYVLADAKRIRQVVINLAGNAIKFTPHGHVLLRMSMQDPHSGTDDPAQVLPPSQPLVVIEMIDSGIGIAAELQQKIFEPFEQGDSGTTRRFGGTGLGLSISTQLVRQMGGTIEVESRPDHGSTFRCLLPLPVAEDQPTAPGTRRSPRIPTSIALDIHHPIQRTAIADLLVAGGYRIDRNAKLRIVDQTADLPSKLSKPGHASRPIETDDQVIWLARVDDPAPAISRAEQPVLFKPILPDDLLRAIEQPHLASQRNARLTVATLRPQEAARQATSARGRLLVVDDSEVNRTVIHDFLTLAGYESDVVDGGAAAIVAAGHQDYHCILMDLQMPELDGIETMKQIVRQCEQQHRQAPPVIALTAHATKEHQDRCLQAGMKSFLVKPIDPARLVEAVAAVVPASPGSAAAGDSSAAAVSAAPPAIEPPLADRSVTVSPATADAPQRIDGSDGWRSRLLASSGGSPETMLALVDAFLIEVPQLCELLRSSLQSENLKVARRAAHTLKSCLKYVAPQSDWQVVLDLENATQANDLDLAKKLSPQAIQSAEQWCERVRPLATAQSSPTSDDL